MAGPFPCPPFPNFRVSPIGLVAKKHNPAGEEADNYRLIHHLSYPKDDGVNHRAVTINRSGDSSRFSGHDSIHDSCALTFDSILVLHIEKKVDYIYARGAYL